MAITVLSRFLVLKNIVDKPTKKLPKKFTRKYGDGMSIPVFLKTPDDTGWKMYWTKHDDEIWFQKGWKEFATYYSLDHGHLLFFEYQGTFHFDVHIFNNGALEIDYPSHGTHDGIEKDSLVQISNDSVENLDEQFSCQKTRAKSSSPQPCKKMKNSITTNVERSPSGVNLHQHVQTRSTSSLEAKFIKQTLDEDEGEGTFNTECPKVEQLTSTALNKATTFRSEHPSFMLVMKPSFINGDYLASSLLVGPHLQEKINCNLEMFVSLSSSTEKVQRLMFMFSEVTVSVDVFEHI
ncbi:B3 domain-containing transcription factor VRN1 [Spatholobus suberectus]|nr:B3 domain-containing transcription factor VRN1 [Spatholobus suberectus]